MYTYVVSEGNFSIPVKNFADVKFSTRIEDGKAYTRAVYPDGLILDCTFTSKEATIVSNREFVLNDDNTYVLKD